MRSTSADRPGLAPDQEKWRTVEAIARFTPVAILIYFALQLAIRLCLSSNLEVDDAEMVGQIHWAWGYPNSHPPLYHWIVRLCYEAFGDWAAATAVPKFGLLALGYLLIFDAARRAGKSAVTGAVAVAALLFIPVVVWKTEGKLTHSILGFTATAVAMHALVLVLLRGKASDFAWLGCAVAAGLLAKYNFVVVVAALLVAIAVVPEARQAFRSKAVLLTVLIPLVLTAPHVRWVLEHPKLATERVYMLNTGGGPLGLNLGAASVFDGLLSLAAVVLVSVAPPLIILAAVCLMFRANVDSTATAEPVCRAVGVLIVAELFAFIAVVISGGFTQVHERYLVVLLAPLPLWLALRFQCARARPAAAVVMFIAAGAVAALVTIGRPLSVTRSDSRLGFPYADWAKAISADGSMPFAVAGDRPENAANIAIRLPDQAIHDPRRPQPRVFVVADNAAGLQRVASALGDRYAAVGEPRTLTGGLRWNADRQVSVVAQLCERRD